MTAGPAASEWPGNVCHIAARWRTSSQSVRDLFALAASDLSDREAFEHRVAEQLRAEPGLVDAWEQLSADQRGTPSPYLIGTEVGDFDGGHENVVTHSDRITACADFIYRKARSVLT